MSLPINVRTSLCSLAFAFALTGCERQHAIAPPEIRYGEDVCAECGMILSDDRFAAALIRDGAAGRETLVFDDIGCLFLHSSASKDGVVLAQFVRDSEGGGWLDMPDACYVHSPQIETPMAFGIAAFSSPGAAQTQQEQTGGEYFDFTGLARWLTEDPAALDPLGVFTSKGPDESDGNTSAVDRE